MRAFRLVRDEDVSGVSGIGVVAEGIQFSDGRVAMRWMTDGPRSTVTWDDIESAEQIHGHDGRTRVEWVWPTDAELELAALPSSEFLGG